MQGGRVTSGMTVAGCATATLAVLAGGCASASDLRQAPGPGGDPLFDHADHLGDVRLEHPPYPGIDGGTFDLEHFTLERSREGWRVEATFTSPVPTLTEVRAARDRVVAMVPQTLDVYLDLTPDAGHLAALPGRDFRVPASEAWDRVLVVSSVPDVDEAGVVHALRVTPSGRRLVATFPADAITAPVRGMLVVVLATSATAQGRVRPAGRGAAECRVWDEIRCHLVGDGPPVLDALAQDVRPDRPLPLTYVTGDRPVAKGIPVVFQRGALISAAPVAAGEVEKGRLATVLDAGGVALGTAVVVSVSGDTASLEVVGTASIEGAATVVFAAPGER